MSSEEERARELGLWKPRPIPDPPEARWSASLTSAHEWVMPIAFAIANGQDHEEAINGIAFSSDGDLLLYRRITDKDWEERPTLVGITEVWIAFRLPIND